MDSLDQERLCAFWGGGVQRELDQDSVLQCGGHTETLLKGVLGQDWAGTLCLCVHVCSGSDNKETRVKAQFIPTEYSCTGRTEWHSEEIVRPQYSSAGK